MNCDYAEISSNDPSNVDEVFCLLITIIDDREEEQSKTVDFITCIVNIKFLSQVFLSFLSLFGIILLGAGMYSGTKPQRPHDDNWLYVIMFYIGIFSFIPGIVGFYGIKHRSKEYLGAVLVLLIPITILSFAYTTFFFIKMSDFQVVAKNILTPESAQVISVLNVIDLIIKLLSITFTYNVYKDLKFERKGITDEKLVEHKQYKPLTDDEHPLQVTNSKFRPSFKR